MPACSSTSCWPLRRAFRCGAPPRTTTASCGLGAQWREWGVADLTRTVRSIRRDGAATVVESDETTGGGRSSRATSSGSTARRRRHRGRRTGRRSPTSSPIWPGSASSWRRCRAWNATEWFGRGPVGDLPGSPPRRRGGPLALHGRGRVRAVRPAAGERRPRRRALDRAVGRCRTRLPPRLRSAPAGVGDPFPGRRTWRPRDTTWS